MSEIFSFHAGTLPLLVSVPHDGRLVPADIAQHMTQAGRDLPDTDWHVAQLYEFARACGATMIVARYSRYVVDLNRPADDAPLYAGQPATGLCPTQTFAGDEIYRAQMNIDAGLRIDKYWRPYHDKIATTLAELRRRHGFALLWDAHSIRSRVRRLFDGQLPVLNLGTWDERSCGRAIADAVVAAAQAGPCEAVVNGRFKGGYITRHHGDPATGVHAMQLELAQRAYMDEATGAWDEGKASSLRKTLGSLLETFVQAAQDAHGAPGEPVRV